MEVDVVRMRQYGVRFSREQLLAMRPLRGSLSVMTRLGSRPQDRVIVATLVGDPPWPSLLPVLDFAQLTRVNGESFVLYGIEEVEMTRKHVERFPQAWWCRLVGSALAPKTRLDRARSRPEPC